MAVDMFLKLDGIKGESKDSKHKDEIQVNSFTFGAAQAGSSKQGGGSGAGKAEFEDITIEKPVDKSTPVLMQNCVLGTHIKNGLLTVRKAGGGKTGGEEYYKIKFTDLIVSGFNNSGQDGDAPTETVKLNFTTIQFEYYEQNNDGTLGGKVDFGWNLKESKSI